MRAVRTMPALSVFKRCTQPRLHPSIHVEVIHSPKLVEERLKQICDRGVSSTPARTTTGEDGLIRCPTSFVPAVSRIECMLNIGHPISTVRSPILLTSGPTARSISLRSFVGRRKEGGTYRWSHRPCRCEPRTPAEVRRRPWLSAEEQRSSARSRRIAASRSS